MAESWNTYDEIRFAINYAMKGADPVVRIRKYMKLNKRRKFWNGIDRSLLNTKLNEFIREAA